MTEANEPALMISKGECLAIYAFDIGMEADLGKCRQRLTKCGDMKVGNARRVPKYFDYNPAPLQVSCALDPIILGGFSTMPRVEIQIYDFAGVSVNFSFPIKGSLAGLVDLTRALLDADRLLAEARRQVQRLMSVLGDAVLRPDLADLVEDYVILMIEEFDAPIEPAEIPVRMARTVAQVLRAETQRLSELEVADAMACRISYAEDDVTVIDWNAALVVDRDIEDEHLVLEAANLELLELRHLDGKLDQSLVESYEAVSPQGRPGVPRLGSSRKNMRRIARLQLDGAVLFERVNNPFKLLGDQYLARLYRLAAQRFHLAEWNSGVLRKVEAIDSLYEKIAGRSSARMMEFLEWIIILLFILDIIIIVWLPGK
jgi:hypothetical protein